MQRHIYEQYTVPFVNNTVSHFWTVQRFSEQYSLITEQYRVYICEICEQHRVTFLNSTELYFWTVIESITFLNCTESQSWACIHKRFVALKKKWFSTVLILYLRSIFKAFHSCAGSITDKSTRWELTCGLSRWRVWAGPYVWRPEAGSGQSRGRAGWTHPLPSHFLHKGNRVKNFFFNLISKRILYYFMKPLRIVPC